jgi:hypothetical protein
MAQLLQAYEIACRGSDRGTQCLNLSVTSQSPLVGAKVAFAASLVWFRAGLKRVRNPQIAQYPAATPNAKAATIVSRSKVELKKDPILTVLTLSILRVTAIGRRIVISTKLSNRMFPL